MTTKWTRRQFVGTYRKMREGRTGREALISEVVDTSGKVTIDWLWLAWPPELCYVCTAPGVEIAFECNHRFYEQGIELPSGRRVYHKLQRASRPLHMKRRSAPVVDDWLHLG